MIFKKWIGKKGSEKKQKNMKLILKGKRRSSPIQYKQSSNSETTNIPNYLWHYHNIPLPHIEYYFHEVRKWRIDFAWPEKKVAVEIEGGIWSGGRHVRPQGYIKDMEKYNSLVLHGWLLLRFTPNEIDFDLIKNAIKYRESII